ncbi:MAG: Gfo/Idh/MocA family oxidoreductase [Candidatus Zixiibacteriota bacterium]
MQPVKIAIIGCGLITDLAHLPASLKSSKIEVVSLMDQELERAKTLKRKYGCRAAACSDLDRALDKVEAVLIATPNHSHSKVSLKALERGLPVLVEKPLTTSYHEATELVEISKARKTFISVGFVTRHFPVVRFMKRLLDEGYLGKVERFHFEFGTPSGWASVSGYTLDRALSGGGVLMVNGSHYIDRMLYWFGYPEKFSFADDSLGGVEANCKASVQYHDGVEGTMFFSRSMDLRNSFTMRTDKYDVEIPLAEASEITLRPRELDGAVMTMKDSAQPRYSDYFLAQIDEFADAVRGQSEPSVNGESGAISLKLIEELYGCRTQLAEPWAWYRKNRKAAHSL